MAKVAFLGTGLMGAGMAARLMQAGHDVSVFNRTREKAARLAAAGARLAETPAQAAEEAEVIFAMLGDDTASRALWLGVDGVFSKDRAGGTICVECSTLSHDWVCELSEKVTARGHVYIDSPVTGLPDAAAAGELTLFVGASDGDLALARPFLEPLCRDILHFGDIGAGTAYKLMVNLMGSVQIAATAEGMLIAEKAGLDTNLVALALSKGAAASPQVIRNARRMADNNHESDIAFPAAWRLKDTLYGLAMAAKVGQDAPFGKVAGKAFEKTVEDGFGTLAESKVIDILRS